MLVRDAAAAEFARDAEFALAALLRMDARVVSRVTSVVEILKFFEFLEHAADVFFVFGASREVFAHFVDGVRAAHQGSQRGGVKVRLGGMLSRRRRAHGKRIAFWKWKCSG